MTASVSKYVNAHQITEYVFNVRSTNRFQGQSVYASATIKKVEACVSLHFAMGNTPPGNTTGLNFDASFSDDPRDVAYAFNYYVKFKCSSLHRSLEGPVGDEYLVLMKKQLSRVNELLINISLPPVSNDVAKESKWIGVILAIGQLCREAFSHFDPYHSALIAYRGDVRKTYDAALLDDEFLHIDGGPILIQKKEGGCFKKL
jgi:hypothetical protein